MKARHQHGTLATTVLASLLPGLREIRAPLAAGYLWLVVAWLLLHDRIDKGASAPGAVDALTELRDAIGVGGIAAGASFVAYLLGALWEPISVGLAEVIWTIRAAAASRNASPGKQQWVPTDFPEAVAEVLRAPGPDEGDRGLSPYFPPRLAHISTSGWRRLWLIGQRLFGEVDETLVSRIGPSDESVPANAFLKEQPQLLAVQFMEATARFHADAEDDWVKLGESQAGFRELEFGSTRDSWWIREASDFTSTLYADNLVLRLISIWDTPILVAIKEANGPVVLLGEAEVTARLLDELPLTARRLVGEQQELFLEASRMKGEVEFRYALAVPIPVAVSVATFGLGAPTWVWIAASVAGFFAGWALLADGWRRDALRNDYLGELLAIGKAKSPTFERLLERARQAAPSDETPGGGMDGPMQGGTRGRQPEQPEYE